jgi:hypothetical protein
VWVADETGDGKRDSALAANAATPKHREPPAASELVSPTAAATVSRAMRSHHCLTSSLLTLALAIAQVPTTGDPAGLPQVADRLERHGITWQFRGQHVVGTFLNGDPWVVGPVDVVAITPACVELDGRVRHGSMVDPDPATMRQGYDSAMFGDEQRERYDAQRNVAFGISAAKPLHLEPTSSLVSVQCRADPKQAPSLQTAAVLTVVATPPAPDAFRPPYVKGDKTIRHRGIHLDLHKLPRLLPPVDPPTIAAVLPNFERLWLDHFPEWPVRYSHPLDNMPDYGRDRAALVGTGALLLLLDHGLDEKRELAVRLVQIGIDLHGALRSGCRWQGVGGHGSGRKMPILLAGYLLADERMLAIGRDFVSQRREGGIGTFFAEDGQTFYVRETSPGVWNDGYGGYGREHDGLAEWGFSHTDQPKDDNAAWQGKDANSYRLCCTANGWVGQALTMRILGLREAWNHPAFFDYMDRYMQVQHAEAWHRSWVGWQASMWEAFRKDH